MDSSSPPSILRCRSLTRTYRKRLWKQPFTAVDAVDLDVPTGSAFALVGPNGAGKTTLMLMALGLIRPTSGRAELDGVDSQRAGARRNVGFVPERFQLPSQLTGREFLTMHASIAGMHGADARTRIDEVASHVDLTKRIDDRVGEFSKGMQQRMAIAQALLTRPRLLVLDEPTSALDPIQRRLLRETLQRAHADGCTILLNSHNLSEVEDICDHVAILEEGRIVSTGALRDLARPTTRVRVRVRGWSDELATQLAERVRVESADTASEHALVTLTVGSDADVPWLARCIVEHGCELYELTPAGEGLEDLFIRTIESSGGAS